MNHTALRETSRAHLDVILVGAGPAGLSAALILGRCRRQVLVCDTGHLRNAASRAMHGYLTRDGIAPGEFLHAACAQLHPYGTVTLVEEEAIDIAPFEGGFTVHLRNRAHYTCRKPLLATGVVDAYPRSPALNTSTVVVCITAPTAMVGRTAINRSPSTDGETRDALSP